MASIKEIKRLNGINLKKLSNENLKKVNLVIIIKITR